MDAAGKLLRRGRQDEDAHRILGQDRRDGGCPLPVHVEDDILALGQRLLDRLCRGPVEIAENLRGFKQLAARTHGFETRGGCEEIALPLHFSGTRGARRYRNRADQPRIGGQHRAGERGFAGARGRRQD